MDWNIIYMYETKYFKSKIHVMFLHELRLYDGFCVKYYMIIH